MKNVCLLVYIFFCWTSLCHAQAIDNVWSYKNICSNSYFRACYDNDLFTGADKYYTQGALVELAAPWVRHFPLSRFLIYPHYSYVRFGLALEHDCYTPTYLGVNTIVYMDRPYTACLFLKTFVTAIDDVHRQRFACTASTGVLGPAALGELQEYIHHTVGYYVPLGWSKQLGNDVILNYQVNYEKQLLSAGSFFSLDAGGMARIGTLSDKATAGITVMTGYFNSPFLRTGNGARSLRTYVYYHPEVNAVGYDATLQGGLIDHRNPLVIPSASVERFVISHRAGYVVAYRGLYAEYYQYILSSEFKGGTYHSWGGFELAVTL